MRLSSSNTITITRLACFLLLSSSVRFTTTVDGYSFLLSSSLSAASVGAKLSEFLDCTQFDCNAAAANDINNNGALLTLDKGGTVQYPASNLIEETDDEVIADEYYLPASKILHSFLQSDLPLPQLPDLPDDLNDLTSSSTTNLDFTLTDIKSDHATYSSTSPSPPPLPLYLNLHRHLSSRLLYLSSTLCLEPVSLYSPLSSSPVRSLKTSGLLGPKKVTIKKSLQQEINQDRTISDYCWKYFECELPSYNLERTGLTFYLDDDDRFYDDKLDILSRRSLLETFDLAVDVSNFSFDWSVMRLLAVGGEDAFLLESVFRENVWEIMEEPVSLNNERAVLSMILAEAKVSLDRLSSSTISSSRLQQIASWEIENLNAIVEECEREMEGLEGKLYYQERRIRELNLDSAWDLEGNEGESGGGDFEW
ncbi:hypothetical protein TrST_g4898 [Triparma strigata]|uniref:Rubisco LSMT substrate-binding domain-containing protein n=1 Tax=Triparma strigata TaxID=1606541 RepID=A0A9W7EBU1_9STRA|nr:hypothetical protein TrST_g4898 [Triparma strigata]